MIRNYIHCLPKVVYVVESIKSRDVVTKTILGGSTLAMYTHFLPKLYNVTLKVVSFGTVLN